MFGMSARYISFHSSPRSVGKFTHHVERCHGVALHELHHLVVIHTTAADEVHIHSHVWEVAVHVIDWHIGGVRARLGFVACGLPDFILIVH